MKKIVLVLCTVMALCSAGSALAVTTNNAVTGSRNSKTDLVTDSASTDSMPCFRAGDTLEFNISGLTVGKTLTIISYKLNCEIGNRTVQYIDQRDITATGDTITYKIRDIDDGIYLIALNDESGTIAKLYYKVGTPKFNVITNNDRNNYVAIKEFTGYDGKKLYSIGFAAKAEIGSTDVSFTDAGVKTFGFVFSDGTKSASMSLSAEKMAALQAEINEKIKANSAEITGSYTIHYFDTVYNVPADVYKNITAKATMTNADDKNSVEIEK